MACRGTHDSMHHFVRVEFSRFKAFKTFALDLKHFNILVGPNNAGKSTILVAFRILAAALRRANARKPAKVRGPFGLTTGYEIDLSSISVAEENIFFNYDDSEPALVVFRLSNKNALTLYFSSRGNCLLLADANGKAIATPALFKKHFDCLVGFVPILGPVEHHEQLYEKEAARLALFNYRAARNFRNIWYHYPERFDEFRALLQQTWPGMDIEKPEVDRSYDKPRLNMYCPEERIPRELFWSGFGFQVWCQMLTHLVQWRDASLFLIDEPDIYLHSDLQRQLLGLLRNLGPDILLATHSTEIITEAEIGDIVLVNKNKRATRRIKEPAQLEEVFSILGSNINPILTQLAKTRRVLFVEGKDFQILGKFAQKLGEAGVGNRRDFAVVPVEGFNPERIRSLKIGMETTLGTKVTAAAILDRDYRCQKECDAIQAECAKFCDHVIIHRRKEIENFLLIPTTLDRAAARRVADHNRRSGQGASFGPIMHETLEAFANSKKNYVTSQLISERRRFERKNSPGVHETEVSEAALGELEQVWAGAIERLALLPGKEALGEANRVLQERHGVSLTTSAVIDAMLTDEIPEEIVAVVAMLKAFSKAKP